MADPDWLNRPPPIPSEVSRTFPNFQGRSPSETFHGPTQIADAIEHWKTVNVLQSKYPLRIKQNCDAHIAAALSLIQDNFDVQLAEPLSAELIRIIEFALTLEGFYMPTVPTPASYAHAMEYYRDMLSKKESQFTNWRVQTNEVTSFIVDLLTWILRKLPAAALADATGSMIPLIDFFDEPAEIVSTIISQINLETFDGTEDALCPMIASRFTENVFRASGYDPINRPDVEKAKIVTPQNCKLPSEAMIEAYLKGTPFIRLLLMSVPFAIPEPIRFEHTHILGGSGHGKTTLLTKQILDDIERPDSPGLIVIDGKGTFVQELQKIQALNASDRLVVINPQDTLFPPALNMFAPKLGDFPDAIRQQMENSAIANFEYIFGTRDFKLTAKQATCLSYCVRLLMSVRPVPTIHTLLDLMSDPVERSGGVPGTSAFKPFIDQQSPIVRRFFSDLFYHPTEYGETKRQIQNRLFDLLEHPAFAAMFSTQECKLDLLDIIQNRKILLVDSSPSALGEKAAPMLGRYIIALTLSAAYARLGLPRSEWHPAFIVIDEAQMFVDEEKTQPLLQQAREFNLGVTLAHQKLADLTPTLSATLAANTSIRYVGGVSAADASFMARNMGCEPEFIMGQRKTTSETHFACHVRGYTEKAVSVSTTLGLLQSAPQASAAVRQLAVERNRLALVAPAAIEEGPVSEAKSAEAEVPTIDPRAEVPQAEAEPQPNPPASIPDQPKPRRRLW